MVHSLRTTLIVTLLALILAVRLDAQTNTIDPNTFTALAENERIRVIVTLADPASIDAAGRTTRGGRRRTRR
ncbi:MAG: hypothetical protein IPK19_39890 [Chloroflexi bacterium]|nr:hypothetical protein [Chloroflexota bacterium]